MPKLYIMCGPSGAGKTTWAASIASNNENIHHISRDAIRYSMLGDNDDYFSHEKEVFRKFVSTIVDSLVEGYDVIADATHLNEFSRRKLTQAIDMQFKDYEIIYVVVSLGYDECVKRNALREGRARVPETALKHMYRDFRFPSMEEDNRVIDIIEVGG